MSDEVKPEIRNFIANFKKHPEPSAKPPRSSRQFVPPPVIAAAEDQDDQEVDELEKVYKTLQSQLLEVGVRIGREGTLTELLMKNESKNRSIDFTITQTNEVIQE